MNDYFQLTPAYLRVYNTSKLKYSARVNYDVACPMTFEEYPVDTQRCNISLESWGHPSEVIYNISLSIIFLIKLDFVFICDLTTSEFFFFQYIVLSWLREKRKYSSSISLAQFDFDVNFFDDSANDFVALGKNNIISSYLVNNNM